MGFIAISFFSPPSLLFTYFLLIHFGLLLCPLLHNLLSFIFLIISLQILFQLAQYLLAIIFPLLVCCISKYSVLSAPRMHIRCFAKGAIISRKVLSFSMYLCFHNSLSLKSLKIPPCAELSPLKGTKLCQLSLT